MVKLREKLRPFDFSNGLFVYQTDLPTNKNLVHFAHNLSRTSRLCGWNDGNMEYWNTGPVIQKM
jgi:hypothetical protein